MSQPHYLLLFFCLFFNLSIQSQLFRDLSGKTVQNLQAQASQWSLSDPSGTPYPISISECDDHNIVLKPATLPSGTSFKKTFENLEDHNVLRFFVKIYYMGEYKSQTVSIKFDEISMETSQVFPIFDLFACSPLPFAAQMDFYGIVKHNSSSVTVEFGSDLNGTDIEINWGFREFSLVPEFADIDGPYLIYAQNYYGENTGMFYPCWNGLYYDEDEGNCIFCDDPCEICYGPGEDKCFTYLSTSPEARLCPENQTLTLSGCTNCQENCTLCDKDVNKCDTCFTTCAQCDNSGDAPQCEECTLESNLVLYQGSCIPSCPQRSYQDTDRKCQFCQIGCTECLGPDECLQCDSETTMTNDQCICNQDGAYFERDSAGCTGTCLLGCDNCIDSQECLMCYPELTVQENGDCRCFQDGFYYQDETGACTGQCYEYCNYCHDSTSCIECSGHRLPKDGVCKCESPRVLIGTNCECPAYMTEDLDTSNCEYIDLIHIAYQSTASSLFDVILQVQMNPLRKWTDPPSFTWTADCTFKNLDTKDLFQTYISTQNADVLLIPSKFLEESFQCSVSASYTNENSVEISKAITFQTLSSSQPQVHIVGGPFQMFDNTELNHILVEVKSSSTGKALSSSDLQQIKWTQTSGDKLDMDSIFSTSKPFQLKFPKCALSKGKIYKFKLSVTLKSNKQATSQEVTIGVYASKLQTQIIGLSDNYHLSSQSLTLKSQLFIQEDHECNQKTLLSDMIDKSTAMYTWECFYLDLELSSTTNPLLITDDPNILIHPDPLKLFYHSTSSPTLTIPSSYFTLFTGYQFIFYLTVTVQSSQPTPSITKFTLFQSSLYTPKNKTHLHIVTSKPSISSPCFICLNENNCQAYSTDFNTKFISSDPSFNSQYSYNWQVNTFDSPFSSYTTFLTIHSTSDFWDANTGLQILFTITDGTSIASTFFTLPWNDPPQNSGISVYPQEGKAYTTKFFLSTYGWTDTDLPITYQFFTTYDRDKNLMIKTLNPFDETILLPEAYYSYCKIGVIVKDNLQSTTEAQTYVDLTGEAQSLCEAVKKSRQALTASKQSQNLFYRFRMIQMFMENMASWEWFDYESPCNVTEIQFKFTAITEMRDIFKALDFKEELKVPLLNSINFGSDPLWNQDGYFELCMDILDSHFQADSSATILVPEEYDPIMAIVDTLIYAMKKPESSIENPEKIFIYINTLLRSTIKNVLPTDDPVFYSGTFYTYFTIKTTYCKVLERKIRIYYSMDDLEANVTLRANQQIPPEKCNDQIDLIFMAFRPNYTVAEEDEDRAQSLFYFDLRDSKTGKSLLDIFTFVLLAHIDICSIEDEEEGNCNQIPGGSEVYGIFDLKNQVNKIFAKSKFAQIQNISVLGGFKFWKSVAFWTVLAVSGWFLASFYWLFVKHPTYCLLKASFNITQKSLFKKINLFFWVAHPLVGIYLYNDPKATKSTKLAIYYQRLVVVMLFSTVFSNIEKGEGRIFKTYILLFNTLTVTPINALFSRVFDKIFSTDTSNKKITSKLKLFIGIFFYLALLVGCFVIMFVIEAQEETSQNKDWAFNFVISFMQDLTLSPFISITYKVFLLKLSQSDRFTKIMNYPNLLALILSTNFRFIYQAIFVRVTITTTDDCQSPRITTKSPLSSDRKLLKFSTLDLQSPNSSKVQTPFEFRSRRASETDMNTVDIMTTEALVTNRFQTFFSEAKPETVKEFSPIMKQNYPKMQSSNLYSSGYSSTKLMQSVGGGPKSLLLKPKKLETKPIASIEFHPNIEPAEINSEEIFSSEENAETMSASQPRLWKDGKTMESSVKKKKSKTRNRNSSKRCETVV